MFDIKFIRERPDDVRKNLEDRNHSGVDVDDVLAKDGARREILHVTENLRAEQNKASEAISELKKAKEDATEAIAAMQEVSKKTKALGEEAKQPPYAAPASVLEGRLGQHGAAPGNRCETEVGQQRLRGRIAVKHVELAAGLVIERDLQRQAGAARPHRIDRAGAVSDHVSGVGFLVRHDGLRSGGGGRDPSSFARRLGGRACLSWAIRGASRRVPRSTHLT